MRKRASRYDNVLPFAKRLGRPLLLVLIVFYLGFHALSGERGLFTWFAESRKLATLKADLADVKAQREALDHKVKLLSDGSLDLDLLDEQSRRVLGMAAKGETVIFTDGQAPKK
jgi:cell division protein FtsB